MKIRLFHDWVRIFIEPEQVVSRGGLLMPWVKPIRMARVLAVGPGKHYADGSFVRTELKVGDRFPFFKAATETQQGQALMLRLDDNEALIRESDVLFLIELAEGERDPEISL